MTGTVALVVGPAESLQCDARLVPISSAGGADRFGGVSRESESRIRRGAKNLAVGGSRRRIAESIDGLGASDPLIIISRLADLGAERPLEVRVDDSFRAVASALHTGGRSGTDTLFTLVVPCPARFGWFSRFTLEEGALAVLQSASAIARELDIAVVISVEDKQVLRLLQHRRAREAHRWWSALDVRSFDFLREAARAVDARAAVFVGSGVTGRSPFEGFDRRMRLVEKRFGLTTKVPAGIGEGAFVLEAVVEKCSADDSGERWRTLGRLLDEEFSNDQHSVAAALAISLPVQRVLALSPDGALDAARVDVAFGPEVRELLGTHREPESMTTALRSARGFPSLRDSLATHVLANPSASVFIGLERDVVTLEQVLQEMEQAVPEFTEKPKYMLQHTDVWPERQDSRWAGQFKAITAPEGEQRIRAQVFEQMLDAFVALVWAGGEGAFKELPAAQVSKALPRVKASATSVWAFNGGAPGSRRR